MGIGGQKRKVQEEIEDLALNFPMDQLNQDVLEQVLSWLPTSNFFRVTSICKKWKSMEDSATFHHACSRIPSRDPWYFMVDSQSLFKNPPIVFDSSENNWKKLNFSSLLQQNQSKYFVPVAASGGLICFQSTTANQFIVCNPVTGKSQQLVSCNSDLQEIKTLKAIAMISSSESYKVVIIHGESLEFSFRVYNSKVNQWEEEIRLTRKTDESSALEDENAVYFLSKCGNVVVSTDLDRSLCKKYSSVITQKNGEEIMYFLNSSGRIISCNLTRKFYFEYPRLLPVYHEYSIDLIQCGGEVLVVVLSEFLESASLRVWRFHEKGKFWHQIAAMPPVMSHEFYGKKVDINCTGDGKKILVCFNSTEICSYVLCNLVDNEWIELPNCYVNGKAKEFSCAFSFEPRIEASV